MLADGRGAGARQPVDVLGRHVRMTPGARSTSPWQRRFPFSRSSWSTATSAVPGSGSRSARPLDLPASGSASDGLELFAAALRAVCRALPAPREVEQPPLRPTTGEDSPPRRVAERRRAVRTPPRADGLRLDRGAACVPGVRRRLRDAGAFGRRPQEPSEAAFPREAWRRCAAFGLPGLPVPPEYGGIGCGRRHHRAGARGAGLRLPGQRAHLLPERADVGLRGSRSSASAPRSRSGATSRGSATAR